MFFIEVATRIARNARRNEVQKKEKEKKEKEKKHVELDYIFDKRQ